ncbi:alpha/beta fold hydrolase [Gloeothece verrucosa]|uniref:Alpha/beta hydrolase fold protein n=1 Tax=Gloeothece verrucosa (strain PCC 7822) TaxID=497965 RepID=E0U5J8_GLOV7|nr:alpha/beta fold hydrolase [Gloeothece verrucosa]ADN14711.1 alpha/beta hydrolase fold protein [Gloeothece verrucosa PCC 7822]
MTFFTQSNLSSLKINIGGKIEQYKWNWKGQPLTVVYETLGQGLPILLLPAFSTVSTRTEMGKIAQSLSAQYQTVVLDWLGFGASERPFLEYQPPLYHQLLQDFLPSVFTQPVIIIAAGHAAGYALEFAKNCPSLVSKLILVAPTWQGPLKVMGLPEEMRNFVRETVRTPLLGEFLYSLNTAPPFLHFMYSRHVYTDESKLTKEFIEQKWQITQHPNGRYAPAAFVTGTLDPVSDRAQFLSLLESLTIPILLIIAQQAPPSSKAEMEAMAAIPHLKTVSLPGALGIHEEYPEAVVEAIESFLLPIAS